MYYLGYDIRNQWVGGSDVPFLSPPSLSPSVATHWRVNPFVQAGLGFGFDVLEQLYPLGHPPDFENWSVFPLIPRHMVGAYVGQHWGSNWDPYTVTFVFVQHVYESVHLRHPLLVDSPNLHCPLSWITRNKTKKRALIFIFSSILFYLL